MPGFISPQLLAYPCYGCLPGLVAVKEQNHFFKLLQMLYGFLDFGCKSVCAEQGYQSCNGWLVLLVGARFHSR